VIGGSGEAIAVLVILEVILVAIDVARPWVWDGCRAPGAGSGRVEDQGGYIAMLRVRSRLDDRTRSRLAALAPGTCASC
jgi:hypothetical protein